MHRMFWAALVGLLFTVPAFAADDVTPAGNWKIVLLGQNGQLAWLIGLESSKDGKWEGKVNDVVKGKNAGAVQFFTFLENVAVDKEQLSFELSSGREKFKFSGKLPKGSARKMYGTLEYGSQIVPVMLESTEVTSLDDLPKEQLAAAKPGDAMVTQWATELLSRAVEIKAKPEEARGWAEKAFKCAEPFGAVWQRETAVQCAEALLTQKGFETLAVENARRAERLVDDKDDIDAQLRIYKVLISSLKAAGKTDNIKEYDAKVAKLNDQYEAAYTKRMIEFTPDPFKGRKEKSDRVVLVELFTGSESGPSVGAGLACDVLGKTFKPSEVILLQYHLHKPHPDPLVNPTTETRARYYDDVSDAPALFINGKEGPQNLGGKEEAKKAYQAYRTAVEPLLEKPATAKLKASATLKDGKVSITAEISDLSDVGDKVRLRLALVEEKVRFDGGNGIQFHHQVVRDMPGGAEGIALKEKSSKQTATVELEDLRKDINRYLDRIAAKAGGDFTDRPLDLRKLYVVAFVQNDKTKEILQATQVEVEDK